MKEVELVFDKGAAQADDPRSEWIPCLIASSSEVLRSREGDNKLGAATVSVCFFSPQAVVCLTGDLAGDTGHDGRVPSRLARSLANRVLTDDNASSRCSGVSLGDTTELLLPGDGDCTVGHSFSFVLVGVSGTSETSALGTNCKGDSCPEECLSPKLRLPQMSAAWSRMDGWRDTLDGLLLVEPCSNGGTCHLASFSSRSSRSSRKTRVLSLIMSRDAFFCS